MLTLTLKQKTIRKINRFENQSETNDKKTFCMQSIMKTAIPP